MKSKDGLELAAYGFLFAPHTNYGAIWYYFRDIQHFHLHGKPYSDPKLWLFWGRTPQKSWDAKFWPPKAECVRKSACYEPLWAFLALSVWSVALWRTFFFENGWPWIVGFKVNWGQKQKRIWTRSIWFPICSQYNMGTYLWPFGHNSSFNIFSRMDDLDYKFHGQLKSKV